MAQHPLFPNMAGDIPSARSQVGGCQTVTGNLHQYRGSLRDGPPPAAVSGRGVDGPQSPARVPQETCVSPGVQWQLNLSF